MSVQEQFRSYAWTVVIVVAVITTFTVGLLYSCFWEIIKPWTLKFLYGICPCLKPSPGQERELVDRLTSLENGQAYIREDVRTLTEQNRVLTEQNRELNAIWREADLRGIITHRHSMNENRLPPEENRAPRGVQPSNSTVLTWVTLYLPTRAPFTVWTWVVNFLQRFGGPWHRWRGSIVIQGYLSIDPCVLVELGELVKKCCSVENRFTLQIANWGIFYHNAGNVHLLILNEGDVPVNIEAMWNKKKTGITMRGVYLNGAQIKVTTEHSSTTLRSVGPPSKGYGNFDELHFPTKEFNVVEGSLIHAIKAIEVDGISLVVRSEASEISYAVPPKSFFKEIVQDVLQMILPLTMTMIKPVLESTPDLNTRQQLLVEYWKGVLQMEMIDCRNRVIVQFQNLSAWQMSTLNDAHPRRFITMPPSSRDREYWQRALHDLSEDHLSNGSSSQSSIVFSTVGRIKFLLGEYESTLLDFDRAVLDSDHTLNSNTDGLASTLLDRAIVKCLLAKYLEAEQDIITAAEINPNNNDIKRFQACLQDILYMDPSTSWTPLCQPLEPLLDLLTGDHDPSPDYRRYYRKMPPIIKSLREFELPFIPDLPEVRELSEDLSELPLIADWTKVRELSEDLPKLPLIPDWTEVRELSEDLPELDLQQRIFHNHDFPQLLLDYLKLHGLTGYDSLRIGEKLAEGGQAVIFEVIGTPPLLTRTKLVLKIFKQAFPLKSLLQPDVLQFGGVYLDRPSPFLCTALGVKFLEDGRCASVFPRHWGDLRRLIDTLDPAGSPFEFPTAVKIMLQIAEGMRSLHIHNILHRDLKASNVLVIGDNPYLEDFRCVVADFECSVGVLGTGFWRAPELLTQLNHQTSEPKALAWSKATDVYSFGMTCYEIITGCRPFKDLKASHWNAVLSGHRPLLPPSLNSKLRLLIEHCWHADPEQRPNFSEICKALANVEGNAAGPARPIQTHRRWELLTCNAAVDYSDPIDDKDGCNHSSSVLRVESQDLL